MHAPDGFLDATTAAATALVSGATVAGALRAVRDRVPERQVPLAGVTAAFVFAAQMVNVPVAAGTTGHLLGGTLAAILLGPWLGMLVVTVVVVVQAFLFADGGLTALGYNVLNMAIVTSFGGYAVYRGLLRLLPRSVTSVTVAAGLAGGASVVLSAAAFSLEWLFGATAPVPFDTVFGAMVGVHLLIGVVEGVITAPAVGAVLGARPDLVHGAAHLGPDALARHRRLPARAVVVGVGAVAVVVATVVSQFSASAPDGLERVAADTGITASGGAGSAWTPFADYAVEGLRNADLSLAVAGAAGVVLTLAVVAGLVAALRAHDHRPVG